MRLLILSFFFTSISFSNDFMKRDKFSNDEIILQYSGHFFSFFIHKEQKFLISSHCMKKANPCRARDILFRKININKEISLTGGVNLGAVICANYLSGELISMENRKGNQLSICEFKDKSMISTGILEKLIREK